MQSVTKLVVVILLIIPISLFIYYTVTKNSPQNSIPLKEFILLPSSSPSPKPQTFILLGDTGSASQAQTDVANSINTFCKTTNCSAAFIAGDAIYDNGVTSIDDPQFNTKFEKPYQDLDIPFFIAFGNHDYLGCTSCYQQYSNISTKWKMPSSYYTQEFENTDFFIIDTENFSIDQQNWLSNKLADSTSSYKIVIGHRPVKTYEEAYINEKWGGKNKLRDLICDEADLYISGHAHLLEYVKIDNCRVKQIISGGGGHSTRKITQPNNSEFFYEDNGFSALTIEENNLTIDFINNSGANLYKTSIEKK